MPPAGFSENRVIIVGADVRIRPEVQWVDVGIDPYGDLYFIIPWAGGKVKPQYCLWAFVSKTKKEIKIHTVGWGLAPTVR